MDIITFFLSPRLKTSVYCYMERLKMSGCGWGQRFRFYFVFSLRVVFSSAVFLSHDLWKWPPYWSKLTTSCVLLYCHRKTQIFKGTSPLASPAVINNDCFRTGFQTTQHWPAEQESPIPVLYSNSNVLIAPHTFQGKQLTNFSLRILIWDSILAIKQFTHLSFNVSAFCP